MIKIATNDKKKMIEIRDLEITKNILKTAKEKGYVVKDNHRNFIITVDKNSPFRIMVSRIGKCYQFYQLSGGHNFVQFDLKEEVEIDDFWMDVFSHKSLFESGHIFKSVNDPLEDEE